MVRRRKRSRADDGGLRTRPVAVSLRPRISAVLAESGHLCQTFCLVATWLGLAPFCTMALADSRIERDLEIDGVSESIIYAAGVGSRPKGVEWAPWPGTKETPVVAPPATKP